MTVIQRARQEQALRWGLWWRWSILSLIGTTLGVVLLNTIETVVPMLQGYEGHWLDQPWIVARGQLVLALPVSVAQWLVLRRYVRFAQWWIIATAIGIPMALYGCLRLMIAGNWDGGAFFMVTLGLGALFGIIQWLPLQRWTPTAWLWIPAALLGLPLSGFVLAPLFDPLHRSLSNSAVIEYVDLMRLLHSVALWGLYHSVMGVVLARILLQSVSLSHKYSDAQETPL